MVSKNDLQIPSWWNTPFESLQKDRNTKIYHMLAYILSISIFQSFGQTCTCKLSWPWVKRKLYYIDRSVLLKNTPLVKFIRNYIRDPSGVFSISSLVRLLMTSFPALLRPFGANSRWKMASDRFVSRWKQYFTHSLRSFIKYCLYHSKIKFISSRRRVISSL